MDRETRNLSWILGRRINLVSKFFITAVGVHLLIVCLSYFPINGADKAMNLTTHLPLSLRLRIGGAITQLPPYAFINCNGTNLPVSSATAEVMTSVIWCVASII